MNPNQTTFTLTQARQNFFHLIKLADEGKPATIENTQSGTKYKIIKEELPKKDILAIAKRMSKIGIKSGTPEEMKKVFEEAHMPGGLHGIKK